MKNFLIKHQYLIWILVLVLASLRFDKEIIQMVENLRTNNTNNIMVFITDISTVSVLFGIINVQLLLGKKYRHYIFALWGSFLVALLLGHTLKNLFLSQRPLIEQLTLENTPGFPSIHSALVFSVLPILNNTIRKWIAPWTFMALIIAFSRMYVGVHYLSDVLGGILVGLISGIFFVWIEEKHHLSQRLLKSNFEIRRQIAHAIIGVIIALLIKEDLLGTRDVFIIFMAGLGLMIAYKKFPDKIPVITPLLSFFERKQDRKEFPGKGSFFLVLGTLLTLLLFPKNIAVPAIIIMAIGDAVTNIVGTHFGKWENPLNPNKTIEGSMIGFFCALAAGSFFISFWAAFFASAAGIFVESLELKIGKITFDDNLFVPIMTGWVLNLWYS